MYKEHGYEDRFIELTLLIQPIRRSITIRCRVYHADGPNTVWHVDGHHKLIRWGLVTHGGIDGGIDGYSRTVVFLRCSDNNRAETVLGAFRDAVERHGLPTKIRSDLGGENVDVWRYMVEQHCDSSSIITGSSTHNQRIERLWRDVFRCVASIFYHIFYKLEDENVLYRMYYIDCLNEINLYCLRFVYLKRINKSLDCFVESWNNHPVASARNMTPNQLFIQGALEQNMIHNTGTSECAVTHHVTMYVCHGCHSSLAHTLNGFYKLLIA